MVASLLGTLATVVIGVVVWGSMKVTLQNDRSIYWFDWLLSKYGSCDIFCGAEEDDPNRLELPKLLQDQHGFWTKDKNRHLCVQIRGDTQLPAALFNMWVRVKSTSWFGHLLGIPYAIGRIGYLQDLSAYWWKPLIAYNTFQVVHVPSFSCLTISFDCALSLSMSCQLHTHWIITHTILFLQYNHLSKEQFITTIHRAQHARENLLLRC